MNTNLSTVVDSLGQIRAQIADLREREAALEEKLKAQGDGKHNGVFFRATVTSYDGTSVAWKAIALKFKPSAQLVTAHTSHPSIVRVDVTARLTEKVAA